VKCIRKFNEGGDKMSYYICPFCATAGETWTKLRMHIMGAHPETKQSEGGIPKKEDVEQVDEIPEGYKLTRKRGRGETQEPRVTEEPPIEVTIPKEIPEEFSDRVKLSLDVHIFPDKLKTQILNVLALHPETHDNPNNFANLLAHICSTYAGGATHARKIPLVVSEVFGQPSAEVPYTGGYGTPTTGGYMPGWQAQYGYSGVSGGPTGVSPRYEDPITRWINYQMWKESKEEEKVKETKLPSAIEAKLSEMEQWYKETREDLGTLLSRIDKQERAEEESKQEARIAELRAEIRALSESKKGGNESDWLKMFLEERDKRDDEARKRLEDIIKAQSDKLAEATKEVGKTRTEIDTRVTEAIAREAQIREQALKDLKTSGWAPKTKTKEELDHELQEQFLQVIPEKIDKGFDKIADKFGPVGTQQNMPPTSQQTQKARSVQEIAEQTRVEDEILDEMKRRGQS
jgi:hypothetical protein